MIISIFQCKDSHFFLIFQINYYSHFELSFNFPIRILSIYFYMNLYIILRAKVITLTMNFPNNSVAFEMSCNFC